MGAVSLVGFGSFVVVSLVVGARLLLLARRTRQLPEAAIGAALFLGGGLGYAGIVLALRVLPPGAAPLSLATGNALVHLGTLALAIGTWRIFRPADRWPALPVAGIAALLSLSFAVRLLHFETVPPPPFVFWTTTLGGASAYAWSAAESLRFWRQMRRRAALGLADPRTAQRFALWGFGAGCATGVFAASIAGRLLTHETMAPGVVAITSLLGFAAAVAIALAFSPGRRRAHAPDAPARTGA